MKKIHFAILCACIVTVIITIGAFIVLDREKQEWNERCIAEGLPLECTEEDECKRDCPIFGKEFFRWERNPFSASHCWCIKDKESIQIW